MADECEVVEEANVNEPTVIPAQEASLPLTDAVQKKQLKIMYHRVLLGSLIFMASTALCLPFGYLALFSLLFLFYFGYRYCQLMYKYWEIVGTENKRSPGLIVGLLFIPIFNLYWLFVVYIGLAEKINQRGQHKVSTILAGLFCFSVMLSSLVEAAFVPVMLIFFYVIHWFLNRAFAGEIKAK